MSKLHQALLACAATMVAVSAAQAADLPVKAKAVEYVKVCSLYGAGFWYVPGTDTCLKIGSYIRTQAEWGAGNGGVPNGIGDSAGGGRNTRSDTSDFAFRSRNALSVDLRTQTEYGTLRSYLEVGAQVSTTTGQAGSTAAAADAVFVDRGFVQFAGFTVGRIRSYFDINSFAPYSYANSRISGDTGAVGITAWAYTAQFGNGVTATLSFEDSGASSGGRGKFVSDMSTAEFTLGSTAFDNKGVSYPDVVGALRIDQAWGYAQVSAALHDVSGGYYGATNIDTAGHPSDKIGWAISGGFTLNNVLGLKGDQFGMQAAYSQGAAGYVTRATGASQVYSSNSSAGFGWVTDGVFDNSGVAGTGSNIELTEVWGVNGFYQHMWNPKWRTSLYGGYVAVNYNANATNMINQHLPTPPLGGPACGVAVLGVVQPPLNVGNGAGNSCSPSFSWWQVGTRTQWNPHPDLDIGLDVLYTRLNTAYKGAGVTVGANGARPAGVYSIDDQDVLSVMFRVQRNFLP